MSVKSIYRIVTVCLMLMILPVLIFAETPKKDNAKDNAGRIELPFSIKWEDNPIAAIDKLSNASIPFTLYEEVGYSSEPINTKDELSHSLLKADSYALKLMYGDKIYKVVNKTIYIDFGPVNIDGITMNGKIMYGGSSTNDANIGFMLDNHINAYKNNESIYIGNIGFFALNRLESVRDGNDMTKLENIFKKKYAKAVKGKDEFGMLKLSQGGFDIIFNNNGFKYSASEKLLKQYEKAGNKYRNSNSASKAVNVSL